MLFSIPCWCPSLRSHPLEFSLYQAPPIDSIWMCYWLQTLTGAKRQTDLQLLGHSPTPLSHQPFVPVKNWFSHSSLDRRKKHIVFSCLGYPISLMSFVRIVTIFSQFISNVTFSMPPSLSSLVNTCMFPCLLMFIFPFVI